MRRLRESYPGERISTCSVKRLYKSLLELLPMPPAAAGVSVPRSRRKLHRTDAQPTQILDFTPEPWFAKFLIIHGEDNTKPLTKISPFVVARDLEKIIGKSYTAKKLPTGDIQIEVQTKLQSITLLSINRISDVSVTISEHRTLNIIKGVISQHQLLDCSNSEVEEGLKDQGVVKTQRIVIRRDGKEIPTKHIVLSFQLHKLPTDIKAGYINCPVRPCVPNPRRCFKCQRFGHGSQVCRGRTTCPKCADTDQNHTAKTCQNKIKCANCSGNHPVYSRSCPQWQQEKDILRIKATENITYKEAKTKFEFAKKGGYAAVVRRGATPPSKSVETQTSGSLLQAPQTQQQPAETFPPLAPAAQMGSLEIVTTTSAEVDGVLSVWDGLTGSSVQTDTHNMELDDDDCMSQKSSSSLPSSSNPRAPSQKKEQKEKQGGRGRGKSQDKQKLPPPRVVPP
ncbi:uncharacterized protein LOC135367290 [Ornithodoros turicata]|uniref:uncharacterized protein LOC135367290 n=1 Tax=Ornithodoros turicata TaxID=34597 RepID=UPI00313A2EEA